MMVPFADCINHHNVDSSYEMIRKCWPPYSLEKRKSKFAELWRERDHQKEATKTVKFGSKLLGDFDEPKSTEKTIVPEGGPDYYHTALKA